MTERPLTALRRLQAGVEPFTPTIVKNPVKRLCLAAVRVVNRLLFVKAGRFAYVGNHLRYTRNRPYRVELGAGTIAGDFNVWNARHGDIRIGANCLLGHFNIVMGPVQVGDGTSCGPHVSILGGRHAVRGYGGEGADKPTVIGRDVWISTGAIVLHGVTIGDGAIIGPGTLVNKDVKPGAYVLGNPGRDLSAMVGDWGKASREGSPEPKDAGR